VTLIAIVGMGLVFRTQHLGAISFWFDEASSWKISQFPWGEMIDAVSRDAHPPLYYAALKAWGSVVGGSAAAIRSLSAIFGLLSIVAAYVLVNVGLGGDQREAAANSRRGREYAALLAAGAIAFHGLQVELSMEARPYAMGTFLSLVAGIALLRALDAGSALDWGAFITVATALSLTHYYGALTAGAMLCFLAGALCREVRRSGWSSRSRRIASGFGASLWGMQAAWSLWWPTFVYQQSRTSAQPWKPPLDCPWLCESLWKALAGGKMTAGAWSWLAIVIWTLSLAALMAWGGRPGRLAAACAGLPVMAGVAYSGAFANVINARYLIFAQTYLLVGWALLSVRLPRPWFGMATAGLAMWCGLGAWKLAEAREHYAQFPGAQGAVAFLESERMPGEPVIVASPFVHAILHTHASDPTGFFVPESDRGRYDLLGGPPLRAHDYLDVARLTEGTGERVWTVDVEGLWGRTFAVDLPDDYRLVRETKFSERFGFRMHLLVREHRRVDVGSGPADLASEKRHDL
jgi:hypothetical protein